MIKIDIAEQIAERASISRVSALRAVDVILDEMKETLGRGERIEIRGFGVFQKQRRKKMIGRDIQRQESIEIPETNTVKFKPGIDIRTLT